MRKLLWTVGLLALVVCPLMRAQTNGLVLNQTYVYGPDGGHTFKIATLIRSNAGTYDHLHLIATINFNDYASNNLSIDAVFGNREGFAYSYTARGGAPNSQSKLVAYENTDSSVDIYIVLGNNYVEGGYTVLENEQETVYASPVDTLAATPPGTLVFDSSSSAYPPATYIDYSKNLTLAGNVKLTGNGASITFPDGSVQSTAWTGSLCGGDYAESVDVTGDRTHYEPGDVLVVDPDHPGHFLKAAEPYSTLVAGIYSTKPGLIGRRQATDPKISTTEVPMAMVGIVPTKVSAENGPIKAGDLLVTSSTLGYAMKGTDRSLLTGAIVGKALGNLDSGTGTIEVLVSLK
jgi:hypothetical protein